MAENPRGIGKLLRKLDSLEGMAIAVRALRAGALHVKGKIARYPPSSIANSPGQRRWYERGYGPRWRRRDNSIGGSKTSETLGRRWTIGERSSGFQQVIGNNVSYGPYVQSEEKQARFHRARGWLTDEKVIDQEEKTILKFIKDEIDKALAQ
ncbi:MAG: hypothetical protein UY48_C0001G0025 [Candidatus Gottesmanbacteria bacterium GW2011_GWB1_49_7]|uniref:HK97 gp10 family phage protein n=1 Tax=Candidatus Gottesmanbacteria bacterium GW2011_GWB1_49_7 TaxID=1618448 RepID=A0A0G1Z3N3_9BACT|nr:MAG: hypothetical protein UY48_C0001G0025 [Candidatus Gottesmanbacteria bacterium GW2011_GWB1_49_7]